MKLINEKLLNDTLNPLIWNENDTLKQDVKTSLLNIVNKFLEGLDKNNIRVDVRDARIVGSNASYNYTLNSDLDIHVIVNMNIFDEETKRIMNLIYNYYKSSFNDKYNIKVKGINVELYIEEEGQEAVSNGIYSLYKDKWIKKPQLLEEPQVNIDEPLNYMINKYLDIELMNNKEKAQSFLDTLYINRVRSLALEGEFGVDNLIFKEFRNRGYIDKLKEIIKEGESKELSLESLQELLK